MERRDLPIGVKAYPWKVSSEHLLHWRNDAFGRAISKHDSASTGAIELEHQRRTLGALRRREVFRARPRALLEEVRIPPHELNLRPLRKRRGEENGSGLFVHF